MLRKLGLLSLVSALTLSAWSCTIPTKPTTAQMEEMLVAAGFEFKKADTPEKMEQLKALPQGKFTRHEKNGKVTFLYADVLSCKCLFSGNEENYARYRELERERKVEHKEDLYEQQGEDILPPVGWNW